MKEITEAEYQALLKVVELASSVVKERQFATGGMVKLAALDKSLSQAIKELKVIQST